MAGSAQRARGRTGLLVALLLSVSIGLSGGALSSSASDSPHLSRSEALRHLQSAVESRSTASPRDIERWCRRTNPARFDCDVRWADPRYSYLGTASIRVVDAKTWRYRLEIDRTRRGCHGSSCREHLVWTGKHDRHPSVPPPRLTLFPTGEAPTDAGLFETSSGDPTRTIDYDVSTRWVSSGAGTGVWVRSNGASHSAVGVVSKTPGYSATVYSTIASTPPTDISGWTQETSVADSSKKQTFHIQQHRDATYFLLTVDASGVSVNEIQLLP